jgi:hypothetical protein
MAQSENPFGSATEDLNSLRGDIYYLPEGTSSLPDFLKLTPVGSIYTKALDVPTRAFDSGFPGVTDRFEWFAIRYMGSFQVNQEGEYGFRLVSDDGSRFFIDGQKIIDNDGIHASASASGSVYLTPGTHQIVVGYFPGSQVLRGTAALLDASERIGGYQQSSVRARHFIGRLAGAGIFHGKRLEHARSFRAGPDRHLGLQ